MTSPPLRLGAGPRSLRVKVLALGLVLAAVPLLFLTVALVYEEALVHQHLGRLRAAAAEADAVGADLPAIGRRQRVEIARLDASGRVLARAGTMPVALEQSVVDALGSRLVGAEAPETLAAADAGLGPWAERPEVQRALAGTADYRTRPSRTAETLVIALAQPATGGGALYLLAGSHRGVRRLVFLRRQIVQLAIYELVLAVPLLLLFAFRIARPIEKLARAALRYPAVPLADPKLLARNDEIATLAAVLSRMAGDLERRRQQAADLGADIAHEFKNPLASIAASAELLASSKALTADRIALISGTIDQSVGRLRRSIDELLALLRLEQAVPGEARQAVRYEAVLDEVIAEYRRDQRYDGWRFTLTVDPRIGEVRLNRARWTELLRNLIDNALVQPTEVQEIVIEARRIPGGVITSVRDHGPGVAPENRSKIFQRFFTSRPPGTPSGTGLGLSVVDAVARAHGGHVALKESPGPGAEFEVLLPDPGS